MLPTRSLAGIVPRGHFPRRKNEDPEQPANRSSRPARGLRWRILDAPCRTGHHERRHSATLVAHSVGRNLPSPRCSLPCGPLASRTVSPRGATAHHRYVVDCWWNYAKTSRIDAVSKEKSQTNKQPSTGLSTDAPSPRPTMHQLAASYAQLEIHPDLQRPAHECNNDGQRANQRRQEQ